MTHSLFQFNFALLFCAVSFVACKSEKSATTLSSSVKSVGATDTARLSYAEARRFDALFLEAICQKERGNYDAEYELLTTALTINPNASEALYEAGQLMLSFDGIADTVQRAEGDSLLRRAIVLDPTNIDYKEVLANYMARQGNYAEAIRLYEDMTAEKPTATRLSILVGLQEEAADFSGAVKTLDRLETVEGRSERYSLEKFKLYTQLGDNEHAYKAIEDLCAEYPTDLRYRVLLGDLYQQNGYHEMALAIYKDVLTAEPENSYAQISLLAYYKTAGQDSLYRSQVRKAVLNPRLESAARVEAMRGYVADAVKRQCDSLEVLRLFQRVLEMPQEDRSMAELCAYYMTAIGLPISDLEPVMEKILSVEPDYGRARLQLLDILLRQGDMERVASVCHEGRLYEPSQIVYYYYEGIAEARCGRNETAIEVFSQGADRLSASDDAETASELYAAMGDLRHEMGQKAEAYADYERALTYKSNNWLCLNNYAYFLSLDGERLDYAAAMSRRTVEHEPSNATYLDTYAWILFKQKQYAKARSYIDKAINGLEEDESNAGIFDHAGDIYYRCRLRTEAVRFWIKALSLTPTSDDSHARINRKVRTRRL